MFLESDRALSSLYVSLPCVAEIDLSEVQNVSRDASRDFLLDNIYLVPEHEALRERFRGVLVCLNGEAKEQQQRIAQAMKKNKDMETMKDAIRAEYKRKISKYESHGFFKFLHRKPHGPDFSFYNPQEIPSLSEWRQELLDFEVDSELSEVLILDAGGYSLDAYARVNGKEYGKSYSAGGMRLTELMWEFAKSAWDGEVGLDRVELKKQELCRVPDLSDQMYKPLADFTEMIYRASLDEVITWISSSAKGITKSVPMLLTGGGFNNPHLIELVGKLLHEKSVRAKPFSSIDLVSLIESNKVHSNPVLSRFIEVTYGFERDQRTKQISFDICGGMIERACLGYGGSQND